MLIDSWIRKCLSKKSYGSKAQAQAAAERVMQRQREAGEKLFLRVYLCKQCKHYHLTSRE